jgi:hypothetical protein
MAWILRPSAKQWQTALVSWSISCQKKCYFSLCKWVLGLGWVWCTLMWNPFQSGSHAKGCSWIPPLHLKTCCQLNWVCLQACGPVSFATSSAGTTCHHEQVSGILCKAKQLLHCMHKHIYIYNCAVLFIYVPIYCDMAHTHILTHIRFTMP